ncbi:hypothetical protein EDB92DRAFT_1884472 [Lactarius akahatsu]|uniref:Coiled-coil domain-containing protein 6 n=1 Tax=Lactarius akahatsu TaxID=416441 RepID=A0AAD4QAF0_9AGAM|nr:hypothetical protein EDB92DRAFT_1884472 [Lactarius akahatsu]
MSLSPPVRRLSSASSASSSKREEDLINAYEAEEERIINVLSRKLEKLQEEKIELENVLEAESESHVNRLSRELSALRLAQQLATQQQNGGSPGAGVNGDGTQSPTLLRLPNPLAPSSEDMLEAMRRENEQLRNRLVDTEREFIRISRLNEIYREELIQHRRRLGLPVDNLIGLSAHDPYFQPTHRRSSSSNASSPSTSVILPIGVAHAVRTSPSVAIPRPPSQIHPSFATAATTPPSSSAPRVLSAAALVAPPQPLSYPSVPPPSLSSSYAGPDSPVEPRGSRWRHGSIHDLRQASRSASRHRSVERGARVAETGQLVPRSRAGSVVPGANNAPQPPPPPPPAATSPEVGLSTSS